MKKCVTFLTVLLSLSMVFAFAGDGIKKGEPTKELLIYQAFAEKTPGTFNRLEYVNNQRLTFDWLMSEAASLAPEAIISIAVSDEDLTAMESTECETCDNGRKTNLRKLRVGLTKPVGIDVKLAHMNTETLSGSSALQANGMVRSTGDGGFVWTAAAESLKAAALRVHFTNFDLPTNAELYIYNADGEAFGPYTNRGPNDSGDFWSNTVSGSLAFIQLRVNGQATKLGGFEIADVAHLTPRFLLPFLKDNNGTPDGFSGANDFCSFNEPCVEDASCHNVGAVNDAKKAVAHMQFVSGAWIYICSGGLVADSESGSQIPYFITANHCLSRNKVASSLECFWQFDTSNCGGACYDPVGAVPRTLGASVLAANKTSDFTFMQLAENPPSGSVFLGWSTADVANANNTSLYRISHPSGAPQAYSQHRVDTSAGTCSSWPRGNWIYSKDIVGATEGGSSGSPVVNGSGQLVGQLSGGCGTNVNETCDTVNNATVDGAFAAYYSQVSAWLGGGGGPGGTESHVDSIALKTKRKGPKTDAIATVTILDENGDPVSGATVSGTFSGEASGSTSATTNSSGVAELKLSITGTVTSFSFCVDNVTHSSYTYNASANVETCDSI
jgi:V8-like Glu-specific endopeptidase